MAYGMIDNELHTKDDTGEVSDINLGAIKNVTSYLLSTVTGIDAKSLLLSPWLLYVCPAGYYCTIDNVILRTTAMSPDPSTPVWTFNLGCNSADYNDYVALYSTYVTHANYVERIPLAQNAQRPIYSPAQQFKLKTITPSGATIHTVTAYVYGHLF